MMKSRGGQGGSIVLFRRPRRGSARPIFMSTTPARRARIDTLTRGLSIELGPEGVRVNCDPPGPHRNRDARQRRRARPRPNARRRHADGARRPGGRGRRSDRVSARRQRGVLHHRRDSRRHRRALIVRTSVEGRLNEDDDGDEQAEEKRGAAQRLTIAEIEAEVAERGPRCR